MALNQQIKLNKFRSRYNTYLNCAEYKTTFSSVNPIDCIIASSPSSIKKCPLSGLILSEAAVVLKTVSHLDSLVLGRVSCTFSGCLWHSHSRFNYDCVLFVLLIFYELTSETVVDVLWCYNIPVLKEGIMKEIELLLEWTKQIPWLRIMYDELQISTWGGIFWLAIDRNRQWASSSSKIL